MALAQRPERILAIFLGGIFIHSATLHAQEGPLSSRVAARMGEFVKSGEVSGVVAVAGSSEGVKALEAVGKRNLEDGAPMKPDTLFRIASMTKPITALGILMLADEGKLAIADPVEKHLPEFRGQMLVASKSGDRVTLKKPSRPITLRDLLTHTSGLPGSPPPGLAELYNKRNHTLAEGVIAYSQRPLDFEPGSQWSYCNSGIDTLGRVIEVVSGMPYETFLEKRLFGPLGMVDTTFYPSERQLERVAVTYDRKDGALKPIASSIIGPPKGARYPIPAGGLYSTAGDLAKLYRMLLKRGEADGRRYVSESALEEMTRIQTGDLKPGFTDGLGFGLGVGIVREPTGVTAMLSPGTYGHGGAFGTQGWIDPKKDAYVILLIQRVGMGNGDASEIRKALQEVVFGSKTP